MQQWEHELQQFVQVYALERPKARPAERLQGVCRWRQAGQAEAAGKPAARGTQQLLAPVAPELLSGPLLCFACCIVRKANQHAGRGYQSGSEPVPTWPAQAVGRRYLTASPAIGVVLPARPKGPQLAREPGDAHSPAEAGGGGAPVSSRSLHNVSKASICCRDGISCNIQPRPGRGLGKMYQR